MKRLRVVLELEAGSRVEPVFPVSRVTYPAIHARAGIYPT